MADSVPRPPAQVPSESTAVTSRRGHFWVGVTPDPAIGLARGPMYVYWEAPVEVTQPYPIVLVHGGGGQGLDFLTTPDGRPGWSTLLVEQGWVVYVVDRPGHGRSPFIPELMGAAGPPLPVEVLKSIFVPPADGPAALPFAHLHTQWPGDRTDPADPALLQFLACGGPFTGDAAARQGMEQERLVELLDKIGPAFVLSNSLGGPSGFLVADARPELVVGLVQLEPIGPAFAQTFGPDTLQWGVAAVPVAYDPPAASPDELDLVEHSASGGPGYMLQTDPARKLANLSKVPIAVVTSEASVFQFTDGPLVAFLQQAGCDATHIELANEGVLGNSHGSMFERNNADVLAVITTWMLDQLAS
ncbi:MAG: lysophospholipase [Ilumatobacteraceae bacterium]